MSFDRDRILDQFEQILYDWYADLDPADFEENPEHPDDNAMRADHEWRQMAGDIPEDEPYVPHAKRPDYSDEPGPLSESRLMHLAGLKED